MTFMSFHSGGVLPPQRHARSSTCRPQHRPQRAGHGRPGCVRRRLDVLHEGGVLLEEGWGYWGWVGPSCSTHNPWPVDPDPRGVGRRGRLGAEPASDHGLQAPAQTSVRERGRTCGAGAGLYRKNPGLTPARPGVHSADMNKPGVDTPGANRWNPAVLLRRVAPVRL